MGRTPDRLPVSVQFMGRHGGESTLLDIAYTLEANHPWPQLYELKQQDLTNEDRNARDSLADTL